MIYIAQPFSDSLDTIQTERYTQGLFFTAKLLEKGYNAFSPIVYGWNYHSELLLKGDFGTWRKFDLEMIEKSDLIIVLKMEGWCFSKGLMSELKRAMELSKHIIFLTEKEVTQVINGKDFVITNEEFV